MKKNFTILVILLTFNILTSAQQIGGWMTHTPGMQVDNVDVMHEKIYAATPYDIFYLNTNDNSINRLTKVNGLSDYGIDVMRYSRGADVIFIGYSNANIDIIDRNENIFNIVDIKDKNIIGNKVINNVFFNDKIAYACCGFGIVAIDLERMEVKDTYIIGENGTYLNVNNLAIYNNKFYAATSDGVYYADVDNPNLADFQQWTLDESLPYPYVEYDNVVVFSDKLVANAKTTDFYDETFISNGKKWIAYLPNEKYFHSEIRAFDDRIVFVNDTVKSYAGDLYQTQACVKSFNSDGQCISYIRNAIANSAVYDKTRSCYWIGTKVNCLRKHNNDGTSEDFTVNGPYSNYMFEIKAQGKDVWIASGGYTSTWANTWNKDGIFHYNNDWWSFVNNWDDPIFNDYVDISCIAIAPNDSKKIYAGSYARGVLAIENKKVTASYDDQNSSLGKRLGTNYVCVTGMDFDSKGTLWLANSGADKLVSSMTSNGVWEAHNIGNGGDDISHLMVDGNNNVWVLHRDGHATIYNGKTSKSVSNNTGHGGLPGSINCFATDRNGTVWVGTNDGVGLFYNTRKIFDNSTYDCSRILVPRNDGSGQADYLLSGQSVYCIAADGANNIWFGTSNGVFHTSNNGLTEYHHFTTENSPLLSNTIKQIAIDGEGNVYFVTDKGLVSYKGSATTGGTTNKDVIAYPNPVRPEYTGVVGIKGLVTDALVKITTASGAFVTHLKAEGGQATWDCTDIKGRKVEPGVYFIFASDTTGKETCVTKILIMR